MDELAIGFTGSRWGMTVQQKRMVRLILDNERTFWFENFHHGCCEGSDEEAAEIAKELNYMIIGHPPNDHRFLMKNLLLCDVVREEKEYLERDYHIVQETSMLLATPNTMTEVLRSGTWTTIRYAKDFKTSYVIVYPDGSIEQNLVGKDYSAYVESRNRHPSTQ